MLSLLAFTVTWDFTIRGYLIVGLSVAILCGSVYLLLATNVGSRLGFLLSMAGLFGWMLLMGAVWWVYGIGLVGAAPAWEVLEVVKSESVEDTTAARTDEARDLSVDWRPLAEDDAKRGEAQAAADEALTGEESTVQVFEATADYKSIAAYDIGGKSSGFVTDNLPGPHPVHYAVIQVQPVVPVVQLASPDEDCPADSACYVLGETPPKAAADPDEPVYTVVLERDLGARRLPAALITVASGIIFAICIYLLHERDKLLLRNRTEGETVAAGDGGAVT